MSHIDWDRLVAGGRAKAIGVSWSDADLVAIYTHKIPPEYVREGILTIEDYAEVLKEVEKAIEKDKKKPIRYMSKSELLQEAEAIGVEHSVDMTRGDLILAIQGSPKKEKKKE